jgi:hypothetical protein
VAVQLPGFQHRSDPGPPIGGIRCPAGHCQVMSREGLT